MANDELISLATMAIEKGKLLKTATLTYSFTYYDETDTPVDPVIPDTSTPIVKTLSKTFENGTIAKIDTSYKPVSKNLTAKMTISNWIAGTFKEMRLQVTTLVAGVVGQKNIIDINNLSAFAVNGEYTFNVSDYLTSITFDMANVTGIRVRALKVDNTTTVDSATLDFSTA